MRIAVIGSSHVGTIKEAASSIRAAYTGVSLGFFAVPGGAFRRCVLRGGIFRAKPESDAEANLIIRINDALDMDLADFDQIWVVGYRFGYGKVLQAWFDEEAPADKMQQLVDESVARIINQFGSDDRVTISPAPYPALRARAPGPKHEPRMARIQRHPERDAIFAAFETCVSDAVTAAGYGVVLQPTATRAAPFATQNGFLAGARDFRDGSAMGADLRHMNHAYGRAYFDAFAASRLGLSSTT